MQELDWQLQLASLIKEAVQAVAPNGSTKGPSVILGAVLDPLAERHEQQAARTLLADALCHVWGFQPVVLRDTPRCPCASLHLLSLEPSACCTEQFQAWQVQPAFLLGQSQALGSRAYGACSQRDTPVWWTLPWVCIMSSCFLVSALSILHATTLLSSVVSLHCLVNQFSSF